MPHDIIVDTQLPAEMLEMIGAECAVQIWPADAADPLFHTAAGLLTYGHPRVDGAVMDRMPNLKVISNFGVGVDHIDLAAARAARHPGGQYPAHPRRRDGRYDLRAAAGGRAQRGDRRALCPQRGFYALRPEHPDRQRGAWRNAWDCRAWAILAGRSPAARAASI